MAYIVIFTDSGTSTEERVEVLEMLDSLHRGNLIRHDIDLADYEGLIFRQRTITIRIEVFQQIAFEIRVGNINAGRLYDRLRIRIGWFWLVRRRRDSKGTGPGTPLAVPSPGKSIPFIFLSRDKASDRRPKGSN